ncbi:MAG: carboxymuconolactone decarboxylase family protein [Proteobacteria bacterium]|nr:carboxymuconolactone decarboxylase family protein [Pseudomonadota bacterium]
MLISITYVKPLTEIDRFREAHTAHLQQYYDKGLIYASGLYEPRTGGFILARKLTDRDQKELVENDPFYVEKLVSYDIRDFNPTKSNASFKLCFNELNYSKNGKTLFQQLHGEHAGEAFAKELNNICPDFIALTYDFAFTQIFARQNELSMLSKELISLMMLVAMGGCDRQVVVHAEAAMNCGASKSMIAESLLLATPFVGFPRVANALTLLKDLLSNE